MASPDKKKTPHLQDLVPHGSLDVDLELRAWHDVYVDDFSKTRKLRFGFYRFCVGNVRVNLKQERECREGLCAKRHGRAKKNTALTAKPISKSLFRKQ